MASTGDLAAPAIYLDEPASNILIIMQYNTAERGFCGRAVGLDCISFILVDTVSSLNQGQLRLWVGSRLLVTKWNCKDL